jgi:phosphatidylinositol dimannoside acyltransferase
MSIASRLKSEAGALIELIIVPSISIILPWSLTFKIFSLICRSSKIYQNASAVALSRALERGVVSDATEWLFKRRLVTLVDHADLYLSKTRSNKWMTDNLSVEGEWPRTGESAMILTFHWGAGMWGLRHAASRGLTPSALVAPVEGDNFIGHSVLHRYARSRTRHVTEVLKRRVLDVGRDLRGVVSTLRSNAQVLAAIDVPCDSAAAGIDINVLNFKARVPKALLRVAVDQKIPVFVYTTSFCFITGRRILKIESIGTFQNIGDLASSVFKILDESIIYESAAWHFWGESARFFVAQD